MRIPVLLFFLIFSFACNSQTNTSLTPADFQSGISKNNIQVLDVRTPGEFQSGHIQHSLLADWNNRAQFMDRVKYVDKAKPVYVYCLSGARSAAAAKWMRGNGYSAVYELKGGINAWKFSSLPLEGASNVKQMTVEEYQSQVGNSGLVLVDFGAEWCPPCIKMDPVIEQLKKDLGNKFKLLRIDAGIHIDIMKKMNVDQIPVFILYKDGKEIWRKQGVSEADEFKKQIAAN